MRESHEGLARGVWDLSQAETDERLSTAQSRAYETYERRLVDRGFVTVQRHELADERLAEAEEIIAARAAEEETETMPTDDQTQAVFEAVQAGAHARPEIVAKTGITTATVLRCLQSLRDDGSLEVRGRVRSTRYYLKGTAPDAAEAAPKPAAKRPIVQRDSKPAKLTIADVAKKHGAPGAFTVHLGEIAVDCASANEVVALARAWSASA